MARSMARNELKGDKRDSTGTAGDTRPVRLQRALARAGVASRRQAEALIAAGQVRVNGVVASLGARVVPGTDEITIDGRAVQPAPEPVYLALHKPPGVLTTVRDPFGRPTVMHLVPAVPGLFPVGRLDAESEGLLLLTTDGEWAQRVSHPRYGCEKEYVVDIDGQPSAEQLARLRAPVPLGDGEWSTGAAVSVVRAVPRGMRLRIVLHEGRKRQVRRMLEGLGYRVRRLQRVRIGPIHLGRLAPGSWRRLTPAEVEQVVSAPAAAGTMRATGRALA